LLVLVLAVHLGWFPTQGMGPLVSRAHGFSWLRERAHYIALPALAFAVHEGTRFARIMRASVADTLGQGYIITARAKGLTRWAIIRGHVLRNSSLPLITVAGYVLGSALGGAVLLETVFTWPGLGLLLVQAVRMRDNMTVVGIAIFAALAVIVINLLVDLLYAAIDPRIRSGS
jgi:peptide/nickel transport system permease protein